MTDQELEHFVAELSDKLNEVYRLDPLWKQRGKWKSSETGSIVYSPASPKDIHNLEKHLRREFPPSYSRFLQLHNGWKHFWQDFTLIGASGEHTQKVLAETVEMEVWQRRDLKRDLGEVTHSRVQEWEAKSPRNLYLENHLVFGANFAGGLYVFDARTRKPDGEMLIRHWSIANGASDEEFFEEDYFGAAAAPDFGAMLVGVAKQVDKYLARLRKPKGTKKKR